LELGQWAFEIQVTLLLILYLALGVFPKTPQIIEHVFSWHGSVIYTGDAGFESLLQT
jgi:hypothetical protein